MSDSANAQRRAAFTVIEGGSERRKLWSELMNEVLQPRALDKTKLSEIDAKLAPRGQLRCVRRTD